LTQVNEKAREPRHAARDNKRVSVIMPVDQRYRFMRFALAALAGMLLPTVATAAPRLFDCSLSQVETKVGQNFDAAAENRSISLAVDDESHTITLHQDGRGQAMRHVTITQIAMNGYTDDTSVGIQISSGDIVLQSYAPNSTKAEFGTCRPSGKQTP
jgi:hypothetical protein